MAKSTQPSHIIICDASAFRALRCERRRYQGLGWTPLSSREVHLAVSCSSANTACIDYDLLEQLGVWSSGEKLHLLVGSSAKRRYTKTRISTRSRKTVTRRISLQYCSGD